MRNLLSLFFVALLASAFFINTALAANVDWGNAPAACLPERAEKWGSHTEYGKNPNIPFVTNNYSSKSACACPDADKYCPNSLIDKKNITFTVDVYDYDSKGALRLNKFTYNGADAKLGAYSIPSLLSGGSLTPIVHQAVLSETKFDLNDLKSGHSGHNSRPWWEFNVSSAINAPDHTPKMPEDLVSRCCPALCPSGFNMVKTPVMVPIWGAKYPEAEVNADKLRKTLDLNNTLGQFNVTAGEGALDTQIADQINNKIGELDPLNKTLKPLLNDAFEKRVNGNSLTTSEIDELNNAIKDEISDLEDSLVGKVEEDGFTPIQEKKDEVKTYSFSCNAIFSLSRSGCLAEGTKITLASGEKVAIEALKIGDVLKTDIGDSKVIALNKFSQEYDTMFGVNGEKPFITIEHPILTDSGWKSIDPTKTPESGLGELGKLAVGDKILTETDKIEIKSIEKHKIEQNALAYNIKVENGGALLANDMFVSGFKLVEIHY